MQTSDYWRKRTMQVEDTLHNKGVEYYHHLNEQYRQAAKKTQQELAVLYNKLAANNGISMAEAKRLLTTNELKEFRWTVEDYIKYGKENALNEAWMKQLENASLKYRISRLEAMKIQMQHNAEVVFASEADGMTKLLTDIYTDGYYRTAHMLQTGLGVGHSFAKLDTRRIEMVIGKPWAADGRNFSERIWGQHRPALVNDLHSGLTQSIIRGEAPDKLIKHISKRYDVAASKAGNLVMTESAYFGNKSQQDCYAELDVEEQQFCATLDTRTSDLCRSMDLKIIKSSDIEIGVNAPPLHCRCRSVMVPYFDDEEAEERAARDAEGNSITVPGDMSYQDWYDKYIKGSSGNKAVVSKPATLKEKVTGLKQDLTGHQQTLAKQKVELRGKNRTLSNTKDDIQVIETRRTELQRTKTKYDTWKDLNVDTGIEGMEEEVKQWQQKVDELNAQHDKYFARPERGTPAYDEWRAWRKGVDYEKLFDNLVEAKSGLVDAESQLKRMQEMKSFVAGVDIDDLSKQIATLDDELLNKRNSVATLTDDIAHLTDDIADTRLTIENTYRRAGKEFMDELDSSQFISADAVEELREKQHQAYRDYLNEIDRAKRSDLFDRYADLNKQYHELRRRMPIENAETIKNAVAQVRSVGASNVDDLVKVHLNNSRSHMRGAVVEAYSHYPTEWVDASAAMGKMSLKKVDRGFYSHGRALMAISGNENCQQVRTAIHEIGHRFERAVDDLLEIEKTFYDRRTKGEELQWLGGNYSLSEKSRFDDFFNKYIGKDYGETAYEIVSMGFEYGYTEPLTLMKDTEMAELIYGLLLIK